MTRSAIGRPWVALVSSLVSTGLGHIYLDRTVLGLTLFGANASLVVLARTLAAADPPRARVFLVSIGAACFVLWIGAAVDAWRASRRADAEMPPGPRAPWYVYALFALVSLTEVAAWGSAIREHVVQLYRVASSSMVPTLAAGEGVLVNRYAYDEGPICRGDVVILKSPNARYQHHIKRVLALPGDTVEVRGGGIYVNGERAPSPDDQVSGSVDAQADPPTVAEAPRVKVPNGQCFVLGDNRRHSLDSREYGPVPMVDVVGRVDVVLRGGISRLANGACRR
jgi:signal peptidase I